jgi:competence protein CoiA
MQLYALDKNSPILAIHATRHQNYCCPECRGVVRLRRGRFRQCHFFHLRSHLFCRQHQKSLTHVQIQLHLKSLIPEVMLEKPLPEIGRIADALWENRKTIFEVQYSPISLEEVMRRNADYGKMGYTVVWLLHDSRFNRKQLTPAELYLRQGPSYFVNGTKIYDQVEVIRDGRRVFKGPPIPIDLTLPWTSKRNTFLEKRHLFRLPWKRTYRKFLTLILERFSSY